MSDGELTRFEVLRDLEQRRLTIEATARLLGGSEIVCGRGPKGLVGEIRSPFGGWLSETRRLRRAPARSDRYDLGRSVHTLFVIVRIGSVWRLSWPGYHLRASAERQYEEQRGEPPMQLHWLRWARPGSGHCSARCWALTG